MITVEQFLSAVLPSRGYYQFLGLSDRPFQRPVSSLGELAGLARWADGKGMDAYFGVSSFGDKQRQKLDGTWEVSRLADNSILHRSLRIDVDCGAGKPYADHAAALQALGAFNRAVGLPQPWIVNSGGGLHVYWPFQVDVPTDTWLQLAGKLAGAAQQHGFGVDPTTTVDAARVLRMPGTWNRKQSEWRAVQIVHAPATAPDLRRIAQRLDPYPLLLVAPGAAQGLGFSAQVPAALRGAATTALGGERPPYKMRGVIAQCPGMTAMFQTRGRHAAEPLWKLTLDLVNKSDESEEGKYRLAAALSDGHPGFSMEAFSRKWSQVQYQDNEPARCDKFAQAGMPQCQTCPLRRPGMSPVVLGRPQADRPMLAPDGAAAAPAVSSVAAPLPTPPVAHLATQAPAPPPVGTRSGVFVTYPGQSRIDLVDGTLVPGLSIRGGYPCVSVKVSEDSEGKPVFGDKPIGSYKWLGAERLVKFEGEAAAELVLHLDRGLDGPVEVRLSASNVHDTRALAARFADSGCYYSPGDIKILQEKFFVAFLNQLQQTRKASQLAGRNGWTRDFKGFLLGAQFHTASGSEAIRTQGDAEEMAGYHVAGDEQRWRAAFDLAMSGGAERQALVALAIAAPLMAFTGVDGVLFNAYSPESGVGKSTLCNAALSVWGSPNALRKDFRDTNASLFRLAAVTGNLPLVVDEFTNVTGQALSDYVYGVTQGREKTRMRSDQSVRKPTERWCLPIITTSNNSVHDKLQQFRSDGQGEVARVFEMRLRPLHLSAAELTHAQRTLPNLLTDYGFLGPRIAALLTKHDVSHWQKAVSEAVQWWTIRMQAHAADRFRASTAALITLGARIGQSLGLNFDVPAVIAAVERHWKLQVEALAKEQMLPDTYLDDYLRQHWNDLAIFGGADGNSLLREARGPYVGEIRNKPTAPGQRPVVDRILIPKLVVKSYIRSLGGSYAAFLEWAQREIEVGGVVRAMGKQRTLRGSLGSTVDVLVLDPRVLGTLTLVGSVEGLDDQQATA